MSDMIFENAAGSVDATVVRLLGTLSEAAAAPLEYVARWKRRTGRKAVGVLPMNFPLELVHAAGALPSLVQESSEAITDGRSLIYEFYCAYSRSLADQGGQGPGWTCSMRSTPSITASPCSARSTRCASR
ncbi:hypothetical protein ACFSTD_06990 [Novosphingobium colocasiae]